MAQHQEILGGENVPTLRTDTPHATSRLQNGPLTSRRPLVDPFQSDNDSKSTQNSSYNCRRVVGGRGLTHRPPAKRPLYSNCGHLIHSYAFLKSIQDGR